MLNCILWQINWSNWALVAIAILAAYIAIGTLKAIKRQAELAEHALYRVQAAILHVQQMGQRDDIVSAFVYNFGETPGFITEWSMRAGFFQAIPETEPERAYATPSIYTAEIAVWKGQESEFTCTVEDTSKNNPEAKGHFLVYGYFIYRDVFERRFKKGFGMIWHDERFRRIPHKTFNYEKEINEQ